MFYLRHETWDRRLPYSIPVCMFIIGQTMNRKTDISFSLFSSSFAKITVKENQVDSIHEPYVYNVYILSIYCIYILFFLLPSWRGASFQIVLMTISCNVNNSFNALLNVKESVRVIEWIEYIAIEMYYCTNILNISAMLKSVNSIDDASPIVRMHIAVVVVVIFLVITESRKSPLMAWC